MVIFSYLDTIRAIIEQLTASERIQDGIFVIVDHIVSANGRQVLSHRREDALFELNNIGVMEDGITSWDFSSLMYNKTKIILANRNGKLIPCRTSNTSRILVFRARSAKSEQCLEVVWQ